MAFPDLFRGRFGVFSAFLAGAVLCGALLAGCGGGGGGGVSGPISASGTVVKAVIDGATVTLHRINSTDGSIGAQVAGPFSTAADGTWSGELPAGEVGPFIVRVTGGSYVDEATGNTINLGAGDELLGLFHAALGTSAAVTPFTHAMVAEVQNTVGTGGDAATAVTSVVAAFTGLLGFDPTQVQPVDPNNIPAGVAANPGAYAALLGGLAEAANQALVGSGLTNPFGVVIALANDLADGVWDGLGPDGNPIMVDATAGPISLPVLDASGLGALITAMQTFAAAHANLAGLMLPTSLTFPAPPTTTGALNFSGPGVSMLGVTSFTPTGLFVQTSTFGDLLLFSDDAEMIITVALNNVGSNVFQVSVQGLAPSFLTWSNFGSPLVGTTLSSTSVGFNNVVLPNETLGNLTLNGSMAR